MAAWCYGLSLVIFVSSWHLRNSVLMAWSPVEPVWVGAIAVGMCVVHRLGYPLGLPGAVTAPVWIFALATLPGAFLGGQGGYAPTKVSLLYLVTLPLLCGAVVLLDSPQARWRWACAQAIVGGAVVLAMVAFNDVGSIEETARYSLASVDTISTARIIGAAVVALLVLAVASSSGRWWAAVAAVLGLAAMVQVGSRGPLLSALVTLAVVVVSTRRVHGRRTQAVLLVSMMLGALYAFAVSSQSAGAARIARAFESPFDDPARRELVGDGLQAGMASPQGLGWGAFPELSAVGARLQNSDGNAYPHNVFVELFVEGGVLAVLAFVVLAGLALARLRRLVADPRELAVLATTVYWILAAQTSSDLNGNRAMWVGIAAGLAAYGAAVATSRSGIDSRNDPDVAKFRHSREQSG